MSIVSFMYLYTIWTVRLQFSVCGGPHVPVGHVTVVDVYHSHTGQGCRQRERAQTERGEYSTLKHIYTCPVWLTLGDVSSSSHQV